MHDTALRLGRLAIEIYGPQDAGSILDIGSADINGSLRQFAKPSIRYIGVDFDEGPGVDIVVEPGAPLHFSDGEFDLVVATSVLEHDPAFWQTFLEMCRLAAPGGHVYINSPSNGIVHRYPEDHWRFYPDCGKALARWARSQRHDVELVESFTARREGDIWNDFVAVFRKRPAGPQSPNRALHAQVACENIILGDEGLLQQPAYEAEDMRLMKAAQETAAVAARERDDPRVDLASALGSQADAISRIALLDTQAQGARAERARLAAQCEVLQAAVETATGKEEAFTSELSRLSALNEDGLRKLSESEKWNFALARERAALERQVGALDRKLARSQREVTDLRAAVQDAKGEKKVITQTLALAEKDRAKLESDCAVLQAKFDQVARHLEEREEELRRLGEDFNLLQIRLLERNREVGALSLRVASEDRKAQAVEAERDWLALIGAALLETGPWWWRLAGPRRRAAMIERRLKRRGLFDADAYFSRYPDVRSSGMPALVHYLLHGRLESRIRD